MTFDGRAVGQRMAINLIGDAFRMLAVDFSTVDREGALAALARIELMIADALTDFREKSGEGIRVYDETFAAIIETISALVEESREAVKRGRADPE